MFWRMGNRIGACLDRRRSSLRRILFRRISPGFSMVVPKWILVVALVTFVLMFNRYRLSKSHTLRRSAHLGEDCRSGGEKCSAVLPVITTFAKLKTTTTRKVGVETTQLSHLEAMHILPTDDQERPPEAGPRPTRRAKLLIVSYFDLGPLHIGDILSRHPDVFYYDEPLLPFDSSTLKDGQEPVSRKSVAEATEYLEELFDCRILDSKMGYSDVITRKMANKAYSSCAKSSFGNVSECVQDSCRSSPIVLSKTIRLYVQDVRGFLSRHRGVAKVLILQRDPRVNLVLRNKKVKPGWTAGSDMFFQGRSLCSRMLHDVQEARRLEVGRYRIVLFEHFLKRPEVVLRRLLSFAGVHCDAEDARRLLRKSDAYRQIRRALLNRWDWIPDDEAGLSVDKACGFFYKKSLYNPMRQSRGFLQRYNLCKYCD